MSTPDPAETEKVTILTEADLVSLAPPGVKAPNIESVHRDLAVANSYRQEFIKSLILIAGALFAFSVSFRPELRAVEHGELFWIAWIGLGLSMVGGFGQLAAWERFYASYQRFEWKGRNGKSSRDAINCARQLALFFQVTGFIIGVSALGSFTALNLANVEKTKTTARLVEWRVASVRLELDVKMAKTG